MPSDFDAEFESDAAPDLFDTFGAAVTHRPLGDAASDTSVTAIFHETFPRTTQDRGVGIERRATIDVADSVSANERDRWQVNSQWWETETVEGASGGMIRVTLVRPQDELRSPQKTASIV